MILSQYTISNFNNGAVQVPAKGLFVLPEKVLQFGATSELLAGPDRIIDKANRQGVFHGCVVVVEQSAAIAASFESQDWLYTVQTNGSKAGPVTYNINVAISRVLPVKEAWQQVLECAHNPEMKIVLSHTTTEALQLQNDNLRQHPPATFPGRLLAFLFERYKAFNGSVQSGMVIVATEDVPDNGKKLEAVVFELAHLNGLEYGFVEWLDDCVRFCNSSLANGAVAEADELPKTALNELFGYNDSFLVKADGKQTWSIEGDETIKKVVSFALADEVVRITPGNPQQSVLNLLEP